MNGENHQTLTELRDELAERLPEKMQEKHEHGREKYGDSWTGADPDYPLRRSEEEDLENRQAVEHDRDREKALAELADYVNYRLMYIALSLPPGGGDIVECPDPDCGFTAPNDGKIQTFGEIEEHAEEEHGPEVGLVRTGSGWKLQYSPEE